MGLLTKLLLLPITGPINGLRFVLERIQDQVIAELLSEQEIMDELMTLSLRLGLGEITQAEFTARETELLDELNAIRAYKAALEEQQAGATAQKLGVEEMEHS